MGHLSLPMHNLHLETSLVSGEAAVAVCHNIPIKSVSFIFRIDLAGGRVLAVLEVNPLPVTPTSPDELQTKYPGTFSVCVTTHAMSGEKKDKDKALSSIFPPH